MSWQKRVADFFTAARAPLAGVLIWLGFDQGRDGIEAALVVLLIAATFDTLDGYFARRCPHNCQTWIGAHDLFFDLLFSTALLLYLAVTGYVSPYLAALYFVGWTLIMAYRNGASDILAVIFQGPIYLGTVLAAGASNRAIFGWIAVWLAVMLLFAGRRFIQVRLPAFLHGLSDSISGFARRRNNSR